MSAATIERACLVCGRMAPVVNYGRENGHEVGYLGRHWRPWVSAATRSAEARSTDGWASDDGRE